MPNAGVNLGRIIGRTSPGQVLSADADGEKMTWVDGGSTLPSWFQTGEGTPLANSVVPNVVGGLYFDKSGGSGLWTAFANDVTSWAPLGIAVTEPLTAGGLQFQQDNAGNAAVYLSAIGESEDVYIRSSSNAQSVAHISDSTIDFNLYGGVNDSKFNADGSFEINGVFFYTADTEVDLPVSPQPAAWGFSSDGHISFFAIPSGPWVQII